MTSESIESWLARTRCGSDGRVDRRLLSLSPPARPWQSWLRRSAGRPQRLSKKARGLIEKGEHELFFSSDGLCEIVIKRNLGRDDFKVDARILRRGLLDNGYSELPIASEHVVAIDGLPQHHKDLFDRILWWINNPCIGTHSNNWISAPSDGRRAHASITIERGDRQKLTNRRAFFISSSR